MSHYDPWEDDEISWGTEICMDCDNVECVNGMCDPKNWPDDEVIEEFLIQLQDTPDDEDLCVCHIQDWYW